MKFSSFTYCDNFLGFEDKIEFLPKGFDTFNSEKRLRQLFLNLTNYVFGSYCFFDKYEQKMLSAYSLKIAFEYKIHKLLNISNINKFKRPKSFNLCVKSTIIINNYFNKSPNNSFFVANELLLPAANLILNCFRKNKMQLFIDKHLLFHEFVLNRVRNLHFNKEVVDLGDSISIKSNEISLKIYTSWKNIEIKNPNIKNELKNAIKSIKSGEFNQVYLAYPKDVMFKRQIPIFVDELKNKEYKIKVIPYSFRSIIR